MKLLLIRHGQPERANGGINLDPPLTHAGQEQANCLANRLKLERPEVIISSNLKRARQTAEPTSQAIDLSIIEEPAIAEADAHGGNYVHVEDLRAQGGAVWEEFLRHPIETMGGNRKEFCERVLSGFNDIMTEFGGANRVAVFTHGFPINFMLGQALGIEDSITRFAPAYGSITRFAGRHVGELSLTGFNEIGHLPYRKG